MCGWRGRVLRTLLSSLQEGAWGGRLPHSVPVQSVPCSHVHLHSSDRELCFHKIKVITSYVDEPTTTEHTGHRTPTTAREPGEVGTDFRDEEPEAHRERETGPESAFRSETPRQPRSTAGEGPGRWLQTSPPSARLMSFA